MSEASGDGDGLWRFATIDEYAVPNDSISVGKVHKGFRDFLRRLSGDEKLNRSPLDPDEDLLNLSGARLEAATPRPDWTQAAQELEGRLQPWLEADTTGKPAVFYVAPPFAGGAEILSAWAQNKEVPLVRPPRKDEILGDHEAWFTAWPRDTPWILPNLETCFLRRAEGLDLIRELLSRVLAGDLGRGIIGCDGWAWRFLQHVWLGRPSFTITAQALDADELEELFYKAILGRDGASDLVFRQGDDGAHLFRATASSGEARGADTDSASSEARDFWRRLSEYSRGNIGVAAACWTRALRTLPQGDVDEERGPEGRDLRNTIWVTPWNDLALPSYPKDAGESCLFVLHALLLHNGLAVDDLAEILPADRAGVIETLLFLREAELVEDHEALWRVSAAGYPVVRKALSTNDYLCDPF